MNTQVLIEYISHKLHTYIRKYDYDGTQVMSYCGVAGFTDTLLKQPRIAKYLLDTKQTAYPILKGINKNIAYTQFFHDDGFYLLGPIAFSSPLYPVLQLDNVIIDAPMKEHIPTLTYSDYTDSVLFFHNIFQDIRLSKEDFSAKNFVESFSIDDVQQDFSDIMFERQEEERKHNPYDQEYREQKSIEDGDVEQLKRSIAEDYSGDIGTLSTDSLRNFKNLCIVVITLASRSAIRGGLSPELSFSLSDSAIQRVEEINTIVSLEKMLREVEIQYAQMVHDIKERQKGILAREKNPHITRCKDYIFSHLHDKITIEDLSYETGCNPNYLSQLFKQCEGISILQYILREKVNRAKNMLIYSQYSYSEIATYLGFSSQSHLGKQFKKFTGYTLREYRENFMRHS